jgi:hypothetical protein
MTQRDWYRYVAETFGEKARGHMTMYKWYVLAPEDALEWHADRAYELARVAAHYALRLSCES